MLPAGGLFGKNRTIKFRQGKTLGDVVLPLRPVVGNYIYDYISSERPKCVIEKCFVSRQPHNGKYGGLHIPAIVNRVYDLCGIRQNGVRKGLEPTLRVETRNAYIPLPSSP